MPSAEIVRFPSISGAWAGAINDNLIEVRRQRWRTRDAVMSHGREYEIGKALIARRADWPKLLGAKVEEADGGWTIDRRYFLPRNPAQRPRGLNGGAFLTDDDLFQLLSKCERGQIYVRAAEVLELSELIEDARRYAMFEGDPQPDLNGEAVDAAAVANSTAAEAAPKPNPEMQAKAEDQSGDPTPEPPLAEPPDVLPGDALVLYPSSPLESAREYVRRAHIADGIRTLHCYADEFYTYAGSHYARLGPASVRKSLYEFLSVASYIDEKKRVRPFNPNRTKVGDVLDALRGVALIPESTSPPLWLSDEMVDFPAREIVAFKNGLLHLPSLHLLRQTPKFFNVNALGFPYNGNAPEPSNWLAFLKSMWEDDTASIECLQEIAGYLLTADTHQQKGFLLIGPKRCGKGTIARTLRKMIGPENCCGPTLNSFKDTFGLQTLLDKTLAIISDARLGSGLDHQVIVERLLSITGEDPLSIQRKFLPAITTILPTRVLVLTNELPRFADASGALASRFILLVFTKSFFGKEDLGLENRLQGELPGILNWAIEGWQRLQERGYFVPPPSSAEIVEQFEHLTSPIKAFIRERCDIGGGFRVEKAALFSVWCSWCADHGITHPGTDATFGKNLMAATDGAVVPRQLREPDGTRPYFYIGIKLRPRDLYD